MPINSVISASDYKISASNYIITTTDYKITDTDYRIGRHLRKNYSGQKRFFLSINFYRNTLSPITYHRNHLIIKHGNFRHPFTACNPMGNTSLPYWLQPVTNRVSSSTSFSKRFTNGPTRKVMLSKGVWLDDTGKKFKGPKTIEVTAPLERLPWFEKIK